MSGTGDESGTPLFGALSLMTLNINGFRTKIKKGNKMVKKYRELGRHLLAKDVDLADVQEPHFSSHASKAQEHTEVSEFFSNMGYGMLSNFLGEGRGGAALLWNQRRWQLLRAWSLGPRILVCSMLSTEGQETCAISAHFSHRPGKRGAQWKKLLTLLVTIPYEHKVPMADHNSLIVPSRDSKPVYEDKNKTILEAKATETQILQKLQLEDAYVSVHSDPLDRQDPPEGFTFGFGVSDETSDTEDESEEQVA